MERREGSRGDWDKNKMNGYGVFLWPDKKKYYGHYVNNNKEGFRKFVWVDGKVFEGMWKKGKQDGVGVIKNKEMVVYGEWYEGKNMLMLFYTFTYLLLYIVLWIETSS